MSLDFDTLVERARSLAAGDRRAVLGITGAPAAGKTTLAEELVAAVAESSPPGWVAHVPMDGFHLADVELVRLGLRDRKGAPDTFDALGYAALLRRLREDQDDMIYAPGFERVIEQPIAGAIPVARHARLIVSEGNYLLLDEHGWGAVRRCLDEVWYLDVPPEVREQRLLRRRLSFGHEPRAAEDWVREVDGRNGRTVESSRSRADLVVHLDVPETTDAPLP